MEHMLTPVLDNSGLIVGAKKASKYVSMELLCFIQEISGGQKLSKRMLDKVLKQLFETVIF